MAPHGTDQPTHHDHGSMDIRAQEKTFSGFVTTVKWGIIVSLLILIFMALVDG